MGRPGPVCVSNFRKVVVSMDDDPSFRRRFVKPFKKQLPSLHDVKRSRAVNVLARNEVVMRKQQVELSICPRNRFDNRVYRAVADPAMQVLGWIGTLIRVKT